MTSAIGRPKPRSRPRRGRGGAAGFTLIELLMVVVLALFTLAVAVPAFGHASRSNRLRAAARTLVAAHRYARGMAVLRQADMVLLIDERAGRVHVVRVDALTGADTNAVGAGGHVGAAPSPYAASEEGFHLGVREDASLVPTNVVSAELDRQLPDGVRIERVDVDEFQRHESTYWVDYLSNGMCDPFEVEMSDGRGRWMAVRVSGVTGRAEVLEGRR